VSRKFPQEHVPRYGIVSEEIEAENILKLNNMVEKPTIQDAPSHIAIIGRYIIEPNIFDILERSTKGKGDEIQLTDALASLCSERLMHACLINGYRYDIGDKLGYLMATVHVSSNRVDIDTEFNNFLSKVTNGVLLSRSIV
jgi:UTP--glucose-1-phosphate uridylyltransferase